MAAVRDALLAELTQEMKVTRGALERLPDDELGWRPHERSWTLGELATHLATIPHWAVLAVEQDSFDVATEQGEGTREAASRTEEILRVFDTNTAAAKTALERIDEARMGDPWSLKNGGEVVFTVPRGAVLRNMILNHAIHHRGQLTVYMRLLGVPVPAIYGPSADEGAM